MTPVVHTRHGLRAVGRFVGRGLLGHVSEQVLRDLYLGPLRGSDCLGKLFDLRAIGLLKDGLGHQYGSLVVGDHEPQEQLVDLLRGRVPEAVDLHRVAIPGILPSVGWPIQAIAGSVPATGSPQTASQPCI